MSSMMTSFYQNRRFAEVSNSFQGSIDIQCGLKIFFIKIDSGGAFGTCLSGNGPFIIKNCRRLTQKLFFTECVQQQTISSINIYRATKNYKYAVRVAINFINSFIGIPNYFIFNYVRL